MNTKIVMFYDEKYFFGKLCKFFTGEPIYHITILKDNHFYEVNTFLGRRKIHKDQRKIHKSTTLFVCDSPVELTTEFLDYVTLNDNDYYGFNDYVQFAIRWLVIFNKRITDKKGIICSEAINDDLIDNGWGSPWKKTDPPPSPADFYRLFKKNISIFKL